MNGIPPHGGIRGGLSRTDSLEPLRLELSPTITPHIHPQSTHYAHYTFICEIKCRSIPGDAPESVPQVLINQSVHISMSCQSCIHIQFNISPPRPRHELSPLSGKSPNQTFSSGPLPEEASAAAATSLTSTVQADSTFWRSARSGVNNLSCHQVLIVNACSFRPPDRFPAHGHQTTFWSTSSIPGESCPSRQTAQRG